MMDLWLLDERGEPAPARDIVTWGAWMHERRLTGALHIGDTMVGGLRVSTVFLGIDHSFALHAPPILWETMIFGADAEYSERYATRADAERGHADAVRIAELYVRDHAASEER